MQTRRQYYRSLSATTWLLAAVALICTSCADSEKESGKSTGQHAADTAVTVKGDTAFNGRVIRLSQQRLTPGAVTLPVQIVLPFGYKLAPDAPTRLVWRSADTDVIRFDVAASDVDFASVTFPYNLAATAVAGHTSLTIDAFVLYCENSSNLCRMENIRAELPVTVALDGKSSTPIRLPVEPPGSGF